MDNVLCFGWQSTVSVDHVCCFCDMPAINTLDLHRCFIKSSHHNSYISSVQI